MVFSQRKTLQNKNKRKFEGELDSKDKEIERKKVSTKKLKIDSKVKHVAESKSHETSNPRKKRTVSDKNLQRTSENVVKDLDKSDKNEKTSALSIKSKKTNDKNNKEKDFEVAEQKTRKSVKSDIQKKSTVKKSVQDVSKKAKRTKCENTKSPVSQKQTNSKIKLEEPKDFDLKELSKEHILQCISAILHLTQEQLKSKNYLVEEAQPIFMQVTCIRVPKTPHRQMRILLPHSIISSDDEVALFVADLQKGRKKDYEPTVEHYKNLLNEHKCTRVNEVIPMNRVKVEFDQFELKRKLAGSYDYFLVDSRIAGHLSHLLGKEFSTKRKLPTCVRMQSKDLKHEIDYALRKTSMHLHSNGDSHVMQIGNTLMSENEMLENILSICESLSKNYPGGWENIRSLRLKGATTLGLPFYMTLKNKNEIKPPVIKSKRPKAYRNVEGELSTFVSDTKVIVKPEGDIIVEKNPRKKHERRKRYNTESK